MRDIARMAGVSHGTVSNVLNDLPTVRPEIRQRVLDAIETTGYVRNESARQLKVGRSRMLGLIVLDTANPFYSELSRGAQEETLDAGVAVMMCNSDNDPAKELAYLAIFEEQRAQGIILAAGEVTPALRQKVLSVTRRGTPIVLIGGEEDVQAPICTVCGDDELGGRLAAEHLLRLGHTRVAMINGPHTLKVCRVRRDGFMQGLGTFGVRAPRFTYLERPALTIADGYAAAEAMLGHDDDPTAIFCANDLLALGVLQYAVEHNIAVPERLAIVGYDDIAFAAGAAIPLTSIRQPGHDIGLSAADLLRDEIEHADAHTHQHVVFPPHLIARKSTIPTEPELARE